MSEFLKYIANSIWKTGNTEMKSQDLEDGSREEVGGSQRDSKENNENEATVEQVFSKKSGQSALINEQENSQKRHQRAGRIENMKPAVKEPSIHTYLVLVTDFVKIKMCT